MTKIIRRLELLLLKILFVSFFVLQASSSQNVTSQSVEGRGIILTDWSCKKVPAKKIKP
jgi:hypothetical protein